MFPLWGVAIEPLLTAARPRRVVEIGAWRGDTTTKLVETLGPEVELHVVDPEPEFDPAVHEARFAGRYVFHRRRSLDALPELPAFDAALVDGDHNWFTVYHELKLLAAAADAAGEPLPLLFVHDVCWPYGRRDSYWNPAAVPGEFRHEHARQGIVPGQLELREGGLNPSALNAVRPGGAHNGVATALEDFLAEHDGDLTTLVLPLYFGLAIVADERLLAQRPEVAAELARLAEAALPRRIIRRTNGVGRSSRSRTRQLLSRFGRTSPERAYFDLLEANLRSRYAREARLRQDHLAACLRERRPPDPHLVRDGRLASRTGLPTRRRSGAADPRLSVVVVVWNMRRAAARTLHSLSRAYQRDVEDLDYEVIVVENGSSPGQELGEEAVAAFGDEFRYLDLGAAAGPSPVGALQAGVEAARGDALALMIDGAHVLTPGVLHLGVTALADYPLAVAGTHHWYVGPGQQHELVAKGYDEAFEDALFDAIGWPADGYDLFRIGQRIGERGWFDGLLESNCLFVTRAGLEASGGLDLRFDEPGGGYANLDLWQRLGSVPGVHVAVLLGEATFHQVHYGTTTNLADADELRRRITNYRERYEQLRGGPLAGIPAELHRVGTLHSRAQLGRQRKPFAVRARRRAAWELRRLGEAMRVRSP